jgi:hypothetical protein
MSPRKLVRLHTPRGADLTVHPALVDVPHAHTVESGATWFEGKKGRRMKATRKNKPQRLRSLSSGKVIEHTDPWGPAVQLDDFLRVQAADGYTTVSKKLDNGMWVVGVVPEEAAEVTEFGFVGPAISLVTSLVQKLTPVVKKAIDKAKERKGGAEPTAEEAAAEVERAAEAAAPGVAGCNCRGGCGR